VGVDRSHTTRTGKDRGNSVVGLVRRQPEAAGLAQPERHAQGFHARKTGRLKLCREAFCIRSILTADAETDWRPKNSWRSDHGAGRAFEGHTHIEFFSLRHDTLLPLSPCLIVFLCDSSDRQMFTHMRVDQKAEFGCMQSGKLVTLGIVVSINNHI
jgi:hypothetical protein